MALVDARIYFSRGVPKQIGAITVDAFVRERHVKTARATNYPIETGELITDHVVVDPISLDIQGIVMGATLSGSSGALGGRVLDAYKTFLDLIDNKIPVIVTTGLKVYENMIIENLTVDRDRTNGASLVFSATLKEIIIVSSQSTQIPKTQLTGPTDTQLQSQQQEDIGKTTNGQTQQTETDDFMAQVEADVDGIFALFE